MRYFVVEYLQKPDGKYDESATLEDRIRPKMLQRAMVILDFKDRKVVKLRADADQPRDFNRIATFYKNNRYAEVIGLLEDKYQMLDAAEEAIKQVAAEEKVEENTD